jgi:hypothetical protein
MDSVTGIGYKPHSCYIRFTYAENGREYEGLTGISALKVKRVAPGAIIRARNSAARPASYYVQDPYCP